MEHKNNANLAKSLSCALEEGVGGEEPAVKPWFESISRMRTLFQKFSKESLPHDNQDVLFTTIEEAWPVFFEEETQKRNKHIQLLYRALTDIPLNQLSTTLSHFRGYAKSQCAELVEEDILVGLQIYARVAHECTEEDFTLAFSGEELPPISLTEQEMETLNGGIQLGQVKKILLKLPKSLKQPLK